MASGASGAVGLNCVSLATEPQGAGARWTLPPGVQSRALRPRADPGWPQSRGIAWWYDNHCDEKQRCCKDRTCPLEDSSFPVATCLSGSGLGPGWLCWRPLGMVLAPRASDTRWGQAGSVALAVGSLCLHPGLPLPTGSLARSLPPPSVRWDLCSFTMAAVTNDHSAVA